MDRSGVFMGASEAAAEPVNERLHNFHSILPAGRRPPAPKGTMKVREGWNAGAGRGRCETRGGPVPGSQARNSSTSNKAYPRRHSPRALPASGTQYL